MKYDIFVSGGGSAKENFNVDQLFFDSLLGKRLLYLPIGLKRSFVGYDGCIDWFRSVLRLHQKSDISLSVWINLNKKSEKISRDNFDGIYIGGASDTFELHKNLLKHNIYQEIMDFSKNKGIVYGGSGGGTVLGCSINYDQFEKKLPPVKSESANLCFGYSFFTHLNDINKPLIENGSFGPVIGLPEGSGFCVNYNTREGLFLGTKSGVISNFDKQKYLSDHQSINL